MTSRSDHGHLETTTVGDASWRVSDSSIPEEDPRHVVAFVESHDDVVEVVWIRGATSAPGGFHDLDEALGAIDDVITTGEVRNALVASRPVSDSGRGPLDHPPTTEGWPR